MESAEEIERQISAQAEKFNEISRQLKTFEQTKAYKAWLKSPAENLEVRLVLWPNGPNRTTFLQSLRKAYEAPEWTCSTEEEFLRRRGLSKRHLQKRH